MEIRGDVVNVYSPKLQTIDSMPIPHANNEKICCLHANFANKENLSPLSSKLSP